MGDQHKIQAKMPKDVYPLYPVKGLTDLIDLVDREGKTTDCQRSRTRYNKAGPCFDSLDEDLGDWRLLPLAHSIGRASGPDEDKIGLPEDLKGLLCFIGISFPG